MASEVLQKTRRINKTLQTSGGSSVSFELLAGSLGEVLNANVYVLSSKGKILGLYLNDEADSSVVEEEDTNQKMFPKEYNKSLLKINETLDNLTGEEVLKLFPDEHGRLEKYTTIVPILGSGQRLGTLVLSRYNDNFTDDDLVISEYSATVIGLEVLRALSEELEIEMRKKAVVQMAIGTLSYSELEAVEHIFDELNGKEGLLVASKIADRVGITRSVIVNALRKFESAGVIESRSLGMKGTHIKILNDKLIPELKKVKNSN
ncbi:MULTISPECIES: GTP-sensing pleiotropic transcriptional regulator CodY [unclassified Romboutsia]|uniref:GTP-sensing pleiotropic transcriptional regulator CodY n=1 Tax=unclassified Romboutsia TaxID=2626894 RepID=UPI000821C475|nr:MULTISPECIES: GTP-sensing pleiotropic transcriptional regulator CodY [unclassified Romboutsia]SCH09424.1 Vegetative protein 286B [uncultured Clostridium sp.]